MLAAASRLLLRSAPNILRMRFYCATGATYQDEAKPEETVKCLSAKQIKKLKRPEFEANPDKYYPTETFRKLGLSRAQCKCGHYYWRASEERTTCGDSNCLGKYTFIGEEHGIGKENKITYKAAWDSFEQSLTTARIPCTKIDRYPVIARWRNDVDYVAAGIFCFQPYCVTGEMDPPANPLICPQMCLRFNDLDNIGVTGRHFSSFVMMGIQVFNKPGEYKFFKDQTVEFNYRWLTESLKIDPKEITFIEDIWAGGGNCGPCVQYFIHGMEVGNMVFMQFRYDNEGNFTDLPVKVIDVGVGLQRIPWLLNGSLTSYNHVFTHPLEFMVEKTGVKLTNEVWEKISPYTCRLNVDESEDIEKAWKSVADEVGLGVEQVKEGLSVIKDLYVVLDHTRTVFTIIQDGGLPSNTGGGSNCRNVLRRVFAILKKNDWWEKIDGMDGLLKIFEGHKEDLSLLYGPFGEYKSFESIIRKEYDSWAHTEGAQKKKLEQLLNKNKGKLSLDNWIVAIQSWGIPADAISQICKLPVPDNLYAEIAERMDKVAKAAEKVLYDTIHFPETENIYYQDHRVYDFEAKVVGLLKNVEQKDKGTNIVILDRSAFYPTSGGQEHDIGTITLDDKAYKVYNVTKVGKCFLHYLDQQIEGDIIGHQVKGSINQDRRNTLRSFHTGTHIVYAAARRVLGPHVWQHGAKKTENKAHIDITHFSSLTKETEMAIQNEANRIILEGHTIRKYFEGKKEAESKHGFNLYQGGIVPGNVIRVVNIEDVDVEACCGTHCDNTSEVGWIKLIKTSRISDGTLRLEYVANQKVFKALNDETTVINNLKEMWGINQAEIVPTARRFFEDYKRYEKETQSQKMNLLTMHVRYMIESKLDTFIVPSLEKELTLYFSNMKTNLIPLVENKKTVVFINDMFFFGIVSVPDQLDVENLKAELKNEQGAEIVDKKFLIKKGVFGKKSKDAYQFSYVGPFKEKTVQEFLLARKFTSLK